MWHMVDAVFAKHSLCYIRHLGKRRKWEISKNGSRPQKKNRNSHHIFSKALGQAISTPGVHFFFVIPERLASIRSVVLAFTANKQTNKPSLSNIYIDYIYVES